MTSWTSIALIPEQWREQFIRLAENKLIQTRSRLLVEDKYDSKEVFRLQVEWADRWNNPDSDTSDEDFHQRMRLVPIVREQTTNAEIAPIIWQHVKYGHLEWETASFIIGSGNGGLNTIVTGIEFDAGAARQVGIEARRAGTTTVPAAELAEKRGRKLAVGWPEWIAALAIEVFDGKIAGSDTRASVHQKVSERLAAWEVDEMPISTVGPAISKVLDRLREAE